MATENNLANNNRIIGLAGSLIAGLIIFNGFFLKSFYEQVTHTAEDVAAIKVDVAVIKNNQQAFQKIQDKLETKIEKITTKTTFKPNLPIPLKDVGTPRTQYAAILVSPFATKRK